MTDNPENHSSATTKPKRGRKPKKQQAIEAENTALAKIVADFEALKVAQAARDAENARLSAELEALRAHQLTVSSDHQANLREFTPTREGNLSTAPATPCENFHPHAIAVNTSGSQPDVSSFTHRRQVLEGLVTARSNQPERATGNNLATSDGDEPIIPKPKGQAAKDFNLCVRMGLSKSTKGLQSYNTLIRNTHRAVHESRIPWDKYEWKDIAAADKALLFAIMRERDTILKRFENDWASECLVRQYVKNLRGKGFRSKTVQRSAKYDYLAANSAQRDPSKSRKSAAREDYARRKQKAKEAKKAAKAAEKSKRRRLRHHIEDGESDMESPEFVEGSSGLHGGGSGADRENQEMDMQMDEQF
ncbi:hypothetical protein C8J55DRAFT_38973 [Lentinula edodes]|uniref:Uncharacterized protein n=1 Tax=Lentinula lateritia TaxID=40482 RepID=A0A9W8ZWY2_9AGAR|nr:hypothetical protein C8J55DRAFT_552021 [Lentinula edodes]KAJ4484271.1 hypothetical protein C8J55DRAFT_38973 [Lentinula edodes]